VSAAGGLDSAGARKLPQKIKIAFLFEFGVPHYRKFLIDYLRSRSAYLQLISGTDKFSGWPGLQSVEAFQLIGRGDACVYLFNPLLLASADIVITTFNLRRPHTWMYVLLFPWKKWIFWGKGVGLSNGRLIRILRRVLFMLSHGFVVYTEGAREALIAAGYPPKKISIAYNTLEIPNHSATAGGRYFIFVGRVQGRKKLSLVLPHLVRLQAKLLVIGDEADSGLFRRDVQNSGCESLVEWLPAIYDHVELKKRFAGSIAYVSPGHVGLGVVHAFGHGVPVITIRGEQHSFEIEYCNSRNSYLCSSEVELGSMMERCLSAPDEHADKRLAAYQYYLEKLSVENVFAAFEDHLR
jgi:glycosyltransferase involved in cell wall biosynthesis